MHPPCHPAVMESITREPESDEVTKKIRTSAIAIKEMMPVHGRCASIWNIASDASLTPLASSPTPLMDCSSPVPPKVLIQIMVITVGTNSTATMNSRTVRPLEMRAMNIPTKR